MTNPTTVPTLKALTVQNGGGDVKSSFTRDHRLGQTGEGKVFEDRWDFFSQKREGEDPGRGTHRVVSSGNP